MRNSGPFALTGVAEQGTDAGFPVFVLERKFDIDKFDQCGDGNSLIAAAAGAYEHDRLGDEGNATGSVVKIFGGLGVQVAFERSAPFHAKI